MYTYLISVGFSVKRKGYVVRSHTHRHWLQTKIQERDRKPKTRKRNLIRNIVAQDINVIVTERRALRGKWRWKTRLGSIAASRTQLNFRIIHLMKREQRRWTIPIPQYVCSIWGKESILSKSKNRSYCHINGISSHLGRIDMSIASQLYWMCHTSECLWKN